MLGPDVVMSHPAGLELGHRDRAAGTVAEPVEHATTVPRPRVRSGEETPGVDGLGDTFQRECERGAPQRSVDDLRDRVRSLTGALASAGGHGTPQ